MIIFYEWKNKIKEIFSSTHSNDFYHISQELSVPYSHSLYQPKVICELLVFRSIFIAVGGAGGDNGNKIFRLFSPREILRPQIPYGWRIVHIFKSNIKFSRQISPTLITTHHHAISYNQIHCIKFLEGFLIKPALL